MSVEQASKKRKASSELPRCSNSIDHPPPQDAGETNTQPIAEPDTFKSLLKRISKLERKLRDKIYQYTFGIQRHSVIILEPLDMIKYMEYTQRSRKRLLRHPDPKAVFARRGTIVRREVIDLNFSWNWVHFADDFWTTLAEIVRASRIPHVGINSIFGILHSSWRDAVSSVRHASINLTPGRTARHDDILYVLGRMPLLSRVLLCVPPTDAKKEWMPGFLVGLAEISSLKAIWLAKGFDGDDRDMASAITRRHVEIVCVCPGHRQGIDYDIVTDGEDRKTHR